jgi:signal transduction histidine kinase
MSAVWVEAAAADKRPVRGLFPCVGGRYGSVRHLGGVALLVGLYYGAARVGFALAFAGPVGAVVWLPVGVAAAFLAVFGLAYWPGALIGDVLVNHELALPLAGASGQTLGNVLEVLVIAWLIRRHLVRESSPSGVSEAGWLVAAIAAGTALSAMVGPLSLWLAGAVSASSLPEVMRTWWLGDFCGALVVVPLVSVWRRLPSIRFGRPIVEGAVLVTAVGALSAVVSGADTALTYLLFPLLVWTVFRFGMRGGTLVVLVAVGARIVSETQAHGSFSSDSFAHSVLSTQLFVVVVALSALGFAALMDEHRTLQDRLAFSRARAIHAAELERSRIERDLHDGAQQRLLAMAVRFGLAADQASIIAEEARALFRDAQLELQTANDELRELSHGTHPAVIRELGLSGAIRSVILRSPVPVEVLDLPRLAVDENAEAAAYFVVAEAIANVHKHAHATAIRIDVHYATPWLYVTVCDDGRGGAHESPGSGLAGLRQRVEFLDGEFTLASTPKGTAVSARLPAFPS